MFDSLIALMESGCDMVSIPFWIEGSEKGSNEAGEMDRVKDMHDV